MTVAEYSDMLATERSHEEELVQLRTEYNTYKQRAQSVLKNKNTKVLVIMNTMVLVIIIIIVVISTPSFF